MYVSAIVLCLERLIAVERSDEWRHHRRRQLRKYLHTTSYTIVSINTIYRLHACVVRHDDLCSCGPPLLYYAAVLIDVLRAPKSKQNAWRITTKIGLNVPQGKSNQCVNFQLTKLTVGQADGCTRCPHWANTITFIVYVITIRFVQL